MTSAQVVFMLASLFLAAGLWLMLPRGLVRGWMAGTALTIGLDCWSEAPGYDWVASGLFP